MPVHLTLEEVAQALHVCFAALVVENLSLHFGHEIWWLFGMLAFAALKEYWFDQNYEDAVTRGSNTVDFAFFALGAFAGVGLYLIA